MKKFPVLKSLLLLALWIFSSGQLCTKPLVYGKNYFTDPMKFYARTDRASLSEAVKKTLDRNGYQLVSTDDVKGHFVTGWKPTEANSHFLYLFDREDYGASDGAYYQLVVDIFEESNQMKVAVSTIVKTIVGPLRSSGRVERRVISQLEDAIRAPLIEMTNVEVKNK